MTSILQYQCIQEQFSLLIYWYHIRYSGYDWDRSAHVYSSYSKMVLVSSRQFIQFSFVIVANSNVTPFYKKVSEFLFWINYSYVNAVNIVYILSTVINYIRNTFIWINIIFSHFQLLLVLQVVACTAWRWVI